MHGNGTCRRYMIPYRMDQGPERHRTIQHSSHQVELQHTNFDVASHPRMQTSEPEHDSSYRGAGRTEQVGQRSLRMAMRRQSFSRAKLFSLRCQGVGECRHHAHASVETGRSCEGFGTADMVGVSGGVSVTGGIQAVPGEVAGVAATGAIQARDRVVSETTGHLQLRRLSAHLFHLC